jgi:hypothetical protein
MSDRAKVVICEVLSLKLAILEYAHTLLLSRYN